MLIIIAKRLVSFVVVFETHDVVFAEVVAELHFDERERMVRAVAEPVIRFGRDVQVFAFFELKIALAADDIRRALDDDPVFAAPRMTLETQARARLDLKSLDLITIALFQNLIAAPRPLFLFSHSFASIALNLIPETRNLKLMTR
jgi:hypothetical protein